MKKQLSLTAILLTLANQAIAEEDKFVTGKLYSRLTFENIVSYKDNDGSTHDPDYENSDLFLELNPHFEFKLKDHFSLNTSWYLQNVKNPDPASDRLFEDEGIAMEEFFFRIHDEQAELYFGKANPQFGFGNNPDLKYGIWGNENAEEYQLVGKIGVGIKAKWDLDDYGTHKINVMTFFSDDSELNDTMLTRRDATVGDKGKAGDTESFSSYAINLYGEDFYRFPSIFYNISYRNLGSGALDPNIGDETGYSLALGANKEIVSNFWFKPFFEFAKISDFNSTNNKFGPEFDDNYLAADYDYYTLILAIGYGRWELGVSRLDKDIDPKSGLDVSAKQEEFFAGYTLKNNIGIYIGQKEEENELQQETSTTALNITYSRDF